MKNRYFWEKSSLKKFSIVFEDAQTVCGRDAENQFKTFRKDTGLISFSQCKHNFETNEIRENSLRLFNEKRNRLRRLRLKFSAICVLLFSLSFITTKAQTLVGQDDVQSWNDLQLTVPMSKKVDFVTQLTGRFGKNVSRLNDGRFQFGFIFKPSKSWTFHPFYWLINARNSRGQFRTENRLNLRVGYRFPFKKFGLSHRSWFEYRLRSPQNSWRYRPSLTFEKDLPKSWKAKFYATEEVFYDSLLKKFSRNRFTVGINRTLNKNLSVDLYFMRQNDGFSRPGDLSVVGTTWRVRL